MLSLSKNHIDKGLVRLWLLLFVAAVASLIDLMQFAAGQSGMVFAFAGIICVAALKSTLLTILYAFCRRNVWLKTVAVLVITLFILLSVLNGGCWLFYGFGLSRKLFTLIAETNPGEVREFLPELGYSLTAILRSVWFWLSIAVLAAALIWIPRIPVRYLALSSVVFSAIGLAYLAYVFAATHQGRTSYSIFLRTYRCAASYVRTHQMVSELQAKKLPLPYPETLRSTRAAERVVVVVGESASRGHLSLYGYPLPSTPCLDTIEAGLFRFDDALASSTSTALNLPRLITFMTDQPDNREWYEYPSLLQVFHQLGYRTSWLSNQEFSGDWSNLSSILSMDADVVRYVGAMDSEDHTLIRYDDVLLPEWEKTWSAPDSLQLVFLHLMGSHFQYRNRFPENRRKFSASDVMRAAPRKWLDVKKAQIVADYDNSILYTDSILGVVLEDIKSSERPSLLIYVSDHGENVYDDRDYRGRDPKFVEVPFIVYANEAYRRQNPDIVESLESSRSNPFSTSELPLMLLNLTGTRYHFYDSISDPLSAAFRPRTRYVDDSPMPTPSFFHKAASTASNANSKLQHAPPVVPPL